MVFLLVMIVIILSLKGTGLLIFKYLELKEQKKMNEHQITILNNSLDINLPDIIATFESFVDMIMRRYLDLNINFQEIEYINAELEEELLRKISSEVVENISPFMIAKLSLVYNIYTEEDLSDIVAKTVYIKLLDYIQNVNSIKNKK